VTRVPIVLPKVGLTMTEGTVVSWLKQAGDAVAADEAIAEIETEKAITEVLAPVAGTLAAPVSEPGAVVEVGGLLGYVETATG
jgi:pyruvate/2-oxoglutarate dehydrogenase complex dihydrolipoamide acyltransferase (E2) component